MTDAGLADVATTTQAGVDSAPGCGMPMRSNTKAAPAMAPIATPAASLRRCALAHGHDGMRARAHGTIRASASRRKPATALTCHPSSGHVGGSSQRSAAGRGVLGGSRLGAARERTHCAGAGIRTAGATGRRPADESPDFQRAGAITYTRPCPRGVPRTVAGPMAGCLPEPIFMPASAGACSRAGTSHATMPPSTSEYPRLSPCKASAVVGVKPSTSESCSRARRPPIRRGLVGAAISPCRGSPLNQVCEGGSRIGT